MGKMALLQTQVATEEIIMAPRPTRRQKFDSESCWAMHAHQRGAPQDERGQRIPNLLCIECASLRFDSGAGADLGPEWSLHVLARGAFTDIGLAWAKVVAIVGEATAVPTNRTSVCRGGSDVRHVIVGRSQPLVLRIGRLGTRPRCPTVGPTPAVLLLRRRWGSASTEAGRLSSRRHNWLNIRVGWHGERAVDRWKGVSEKLRRGEEVGSALENGRQVQWTWMDCGDDSRCSTEPQEIRVCVNEDARTNISRDGASACALLRPVAHVICRVQSLSHFFILASPAADT